MKPEEINLTDWSRIGLGSVPPEFYLELFIRAAFIYLLLMVSMRLLGKRMSTQISMLELTAMVSLASAIGVPMLSFDRGILPTIIIACIIVGFSRLIAVINKKSRHFEKVVQGDIDLLVKDATLCLDAMESTRVTQDRLFAQLRSENVYHLGLVKRLYLEANGSFTLIKNEEARPGLVVLPSWDKDFIKEQLRTSEVVICKNCGWERPGNRSAGFGNTKCDNCGEKAWTHGMLEKSAQ